MIAGRHSLGIATLSPDLEVVAGTRGTWVFRYEAGSLGIDEGGSLCIAWSWMSDWEAPQFSDPRSPAYTTASTNGNALAVPRFDERGWKRPWKRALRVDILDAPLEPGEVVTIVYGDGGTPDGLMRAQTFAQTRFSFKTLVDPLGTGEFAELPDSPAVRVASGDAVLIEAVAPSRVARGAPFLIHVRAEDSWGNATQLPGDVDVRIDGSSSRIASHSGDRALALEAPGFTVEGTYWLPISTNSNLVVETNPIECVSPAELEHETPLWGDLHGQSEETVGTNSIEEYFRFARDQAILDFAGHQGNDFQISDALWARIREVCHEFDSSAFVTLPGYEWSAPTALGGDRNVYFLDPPDSIWRSSHVLVDPERDVLRGLGDAHALYRQLRAEVGREDQAREFEAPAVLVVPHVGGRPCDLNWHAPDLEPVVEILSAWGEFEWLLLDALDRGLQIGVVAGSDEHRGRPGASRPGAGEFGVKGGLTCVWANERSRKGVLEALWRRKCFATSGQRTIVRVAAGAASMGDVISTQDFGSVIAVSVRAVNEVERIELFNGREIIATFPEIAERDPRKVRVSWGGARVRGRTRAATWNGSVHLGEGRITSVSGYAFEEPVDEISIVTDTSVSWRSVTTGDIDGIVLSLDAPKEAMLDVRIPRGDFTFRLDDLRDGPRQLDFGGEGLRLVVESLPIGTRLRDLDVVLHAGRDLSSLKGAYWVRVLECDGRRVWTSPIFVQ